MIRFILLFLFCQFTYGQVVIDSYRFEIGAIYDGQNAADPVTEVNGTANFTAGTNTSFSSTSTSPQDGTYRIEMLHTGSANESCEGFANLVLENGSTYQVDIYINEVTGANWSVVLDTSHGWTVTDNQNTPSGGWQLMTLTATTNTTTPKIRFAGTTSSDGGDILGIDNIVITKL